MYPFEASDRRIVDKDRRGELFYYMHEQIIARYNFERFSNRLPRVGRLSNFRAAIPDGYFPKLDSLVVSRSWPARISGAILKDLNREVDQVRLDISDLERRRERFLEAISKGSVVDQTGHRMALDERRGIDILGNMMEASILTPPLQCATWMSVQLSVPVKTTSTSADVAGKSSVKTQFTYLVHVYFSGSYTC